MKDPDSKTAGAILFIGAIQFIIVGLVVAEALYPDYSVADNYISDLGVGPSALIFNTSVFLLGILVVVGSYFIHKTYHRTFFTILLTITGVGAVGVGIFTENAGLLHPIFSLITFVFGALAAIVSCRLLRSPLSYLSMILGIFSLLAIVFFGSGNYLGLGAGGMERMVAYPTLLWGLGFGGHLIGYTEETSRKT
jgi:hypothetical membrane protein